MRWATAVLASLLIGGAASAHEGEQHAEPRPVAAATPTGVSKSAASARHELVVVVPPIAPGDSATLAIYLSDFESNAPVVGATIRLALRARAGGAPAWEGTAEATADSGVYAATLSIPSAGEYNIVATIRDHGAEDALAISGIAVAPPARAAGGPPWRVLVLVAVAVAVSLAALALVRRRRVAAAALLAACTLAAPPAGADTEVAMPKSSQFLLGVRTARAVRTLVPRTVDVLGRVAPRGGAEADVVAPQAGRVVFAGGRAPRLGQAVRAGRAIGALVVVDSLVLRSPVSGTVTGVFAAHGQRVEAGQKLVSVLDPGVVWVHADVFERDWESVEHATRAVVTSEAYPGEAFPGRRLTLGATMGEVSGALEAWYEVPNRGGRLRIGMPVRVGLELGARDSLIVLPRAAVLEDAGGAHVYVHTAPERFAVREVEVAARLGDRVGVRGDLRPGERVVVQGAAALRAAPPAGAR